MIQYNNFLMKREQSRAGSRFAECEKSRLKAKILITLALLLTAVTGAWATEPKVINSTVAVSDLNEGDILIEGAQVTLTSDHSYYLNFLQNRFFLNDATTPSISGFIHNTTTVTVGANGLVTGLSYGATARPATESGEEGNAWEVTAVEDKTVSIVGITYDATAEPPITVAWDASTKTGTFTMPGSDVVLTPQYAPAAQLDENGAPAAVSGLEIAADAAIITAGQSAQGTLLYAVGTSATEKPALTAFAATLPNAKDLTAAGNYYVWYYIQGQDTPQGQEPTAENTFNDSEIMGPVMVELLTNEHTLNIKQSPNITVTVAGTAKAVTDDKVTPVTTGQEVKIKAKEGYKFRKVEVKKGGAATLATALENGATVVIAFKYRDDGTCTFTNNNGTFTFVSGTGQLGGGNGPKQLSVENGKLIFKGSGTNSFTDRWSWYGFQVTFDPTANTYEVWKGSYLDVGSFTSISVNGTDITDQLSELK